VSVAIAKAYRLPITDYRLPITEVRSQKSKIDKEGKRRGKPALWRSDIGHRMSVVGYRYASSMKRIIVLVAVAVIVAVAYKILTAEVPIDES